MADVLISGLPVAGTIDPAVSSVPIVVGTTTSKTTCNAIVQAGITVSEVVVSENGAAITGAVPRLISDAFGDYISVKDFGAMGDGVTDDTVAIQTADTQARAKGAALYFPGGVYMVSQLVLYTGSNWTGAGRDATTIKQIGASNKDLIYAYNSNANWGDPTPSDSVDGFILRSMTLDGNSSHNSIGSGLAAYAARPIIQDVCIKQCADYGMRTEYGASSSGLAAFAMAGYFSDIQIDTVGKHGWYYAGPHDSTTVGVIIIDAGQSSANTYDGFYVDSGGAFIGCHAWTRSTSVRAKSAVHVLSSGANFSGGCQFEGGYTANAIIENQKNTFDATTRFYAAWNGVNVLLTGSATENRISGLLGAAGSGRPACVGLQFGATAGDYIASNYINVTNSGQNAGDISFYPGYTGGKNIVQINAFVSSGTPGYVGTPLVSEHISYFSILPSSPTTTPLLNTGYTAFGAKTPAALAQSQGHVYACADTSPSIGLIGADGSPTLFGLNLGGGDIQTPTSTADFDALLVLDGRGYTQNGDIVTAGRITCIARSPSGANLSGNLLFYVRDATTLTHVLTVNAGGMLPHLDDTYTNGTSSYRWSKTYSNQFRPGDGTPVWTSGSGSPEGVVYGPIGSMYTRTNGGAGTTLYVKESGAYNTNTGWVAK